jgi:hypothetical protein
MSPLQKQEKLYVFRGARTLTLDALDGLAAYTVEPLYASGTTLIVR